ncbi:MAG: hypothetical protein ACFCD0_14995 [Gemmataceae bacterium]
METNHDEGGKWLGIFLTVLFGGGFVVFLMLVSGGFFLYVGFAGIAIALLGGLHYITWGRSMSQEAAVERAQQEANRRFERDRYYADDSEHIQEL